MRLEGMNNTIGSNSSYKSVNGSKSGSNGYSGISEDIKTTTAKLPVRLVEEDLIRSIRENEVCIIIGETGSGKSTQIPQMVLDSGIIQGSSDSENMIVVTQPRRLAARALATRVAKERNVGLGEEVGYKFRFENIASDETRILYATDGILMNEATNDPFLNKYGMVIVDEAHERSLATDMLLILLNRITKRSERNNRLRIIVMSATLEAEKFSKFFNGAKIFAIEGRSHPTQLFYLPRPCLNEDRSVSLAVDCVFQLHKTEPLEDGFLVFLPGVDEILAAVRLTVEKSRACGLKMVVLPLYSSLPTTKQNLIYAVNSKIRKVVYSTNIAETSVTIPGIRVVIDSGKVKQKEYLPIRKVELLKVVNISKAQAIQRAGRAGREAPGKCYRLYSETEYDKMASTPLPEIMRTNLCSLLLTYFVLGMRKHKKLPYVDHPPAEQVSRGVKELLKMKLIRKTSESGCYECTEEGTMVAKFPIDPMYGKILLRAAANGCLEEAITVVAFLSSDPVFTNDSNSDDRYNEARKKFDKNEGDHVRMIMIYRFFKETRKNKKNGLKEDLHKFGLNEGRLMTVQNVRKQIHQLCMMLQLSDGSCGTDFTPLRRSLAESLPYNIGIRDSESKCYRLITDPTVTCKIHPSSCLSRRQPNCIVFTTLIETNACYARDVTVIDRDWVQEDSMG